MNGNILMFHNFGKKGDKYTLSFKKFGEILRNLEKKEFAFISLDDVRQTKFDKFACLTFDDGYKSHLKIAEILNKKRISGEFFIITSKIGELGYLNEEDLIAMNKFGMKIGSHSHTHKDLSKLNEKEFEFELKNSKKILEKILNQEINSFSFPGGNYKNSQLIKAKKIFKNVRTSDPMIISDRNLQIYPGIGISKKIPLSLIGNEKFISFWNFLKMVRKANPDFIETRGIFHAHSTYSDGKLSLEEIKVWAEKNGIKNVLMTDHIEFFDEKKYSEYYKKCRDLSSDKLLIEPGIEINAKNGDHIILLGINKMPKQKGAKEIRDWTKKNKGISIIAHARIGKYYKGIRNVEVWNKKRDRGFLRIKSLNELKKIILENPETRFYGGTDWHGNSKEKILFGFFQDNSKIIQAFSSEKTIFICRKTGIDTEGNLYGEKIRILMGVLQTEIYSILKKNLRKIKILRQAYHKLKK